MDKAPAKTFSSRVLALLVTRSLLGAALLPRLLCPTALAAEPLVLSGTIQDSAGDPLGGARITLTAASGELRETVSDGNGRIAFEAVEPGEYVLRVEAKTHQPLELPVRVTDPAPPPLKIRMKLGIAEEVSVTALDPDEDQKASANNADLVEFDDRLIQGLPVSLNSDGLSDFVATYVSAAAQGTGAVAIVVDGSDSESLAIPALAIERIKVNRQPYSAEFRRPGKARLDVKTRRGSTSRLRGGAAFYLQDSAFAAKNAFASTKPAESRRLFELSLSGPLPRQIGSFFLSVQHEMHDEEEIVNASTLEGPVNELVPTNRRFTSALANLYFKTGIHRLGARYSYGTETRLNRGVGGLSLPESGYDSERGPQHSLQLWARSYVSGHNLNSAQITLVARERREGEPTRDPAIEVNGAFTGGSSQVFRSSRSLQLEARDSWTYARGAHAILLGAGFRALTIDDTEASGFGGRFEFASLEDYEQGRPYVYRVNQGDPRVSFTYNEVEAFAQDEVRLRNDLTLLAGLRYDYSSAIEGDHDNLGIRLSAAWVPGRGKTVFRAGLGFFYERLPVAAQEQWRLLDGSRIRSTVITDPTYPEPWLGGETTTPPPSVFRLAPDLVTPYLLQGTIAAERDVSSSSRLSLEYLFVRGVHLFRGRDTNAPLRATGLRPDPTQGEVLEGGSTGTLHSHAIGLTYRGRVGKRVKAQAQYSLAWAHNDTPGTDPTFPFTVPADNYDLRPEWGRADFDRRHRFSLAATAELPRRIHAGATVAFRSPAPYDITTGHDDNGDGHAKDRPADVTRNTGQGPDFFQIDLRVSKGWAVKRLFGGDGKSQGEAQLVVDAYNLTNRVNYFQYIGVMTSPYFGTANSAKQARSLQFAVKYRF